MPDRDTEDPARVWKWMKTVVDGRPDRRSGSIVLLDGDRREVARYRFREAWPCKWEGPSLDATGNEVAIETIELVHEGLELA